MMRVLSFNMENWEKAAEFAYIEFGYSDGKADVLYDDVLGIVWIAYEEGEGACEKFEKLLERNGVEYGIWSCLPNGGHMGSSA